MERESKIPASPLASAGLLSDSLEKPSSVVSRQLMSSLSSVIYKFTFEELSF